MDPARADAGGDAVQLVGPAPGDGDQRPGRSQGAGRALAEAGINIEMISTSAIRISCVVREAQAEQAVAALHAAFQLDRAPEDRSDV